MITHRDNCRGCFSKNLFEFLDLGRMPLAGGFLTKDQIKNEPNAPLKVHFCQDCGLVQILDVFDPEVLFQNYSYRSSVIKGLSEHFREYSDFLKGNYLKNGSGLLEFGCNDGVLLQYFKKDIKAIGIDVSENITEIARQRGFEVVTGYFNAKNAELLKKRYGLMDVVTGSNVFAHADDIHEIIKAAKYMMNKDGVFIVEIHYVKDLIDTFQYDSIYHEHLCYYSISSLRRILELEDMRIIDVIHLEMHGGGIRVVSCNKESSLREKKSVNEFLASEKKANIDSIECYREFGQRCQSHKKELQGLLKKIKGEGKKIVGFGAPGRGTILLNYCEIGTDLLDYVVDVSPLRAGKLVPGVHIPVIEEARFMEGNPDYALVLAWTYLKEIIEKEQGFIRKGGKFILPLPKIKIVP